MRRFLAWLHDKTCGFRLHGYWCDEHGWRGWLS